MVVGEDNRPRRCATRFAAISAAYAASRGLIDRNLCSPQDTNDAGPLGERDPGVSQARPSERSRRGYQNRRRPALLLTFVRKRELIQPTLGLDRFRCGASAPPERGLIMLMIGPPGAGKSMLAHRLPGILPLTTAEALETALRELPRLW